MICPYCSQFLMDFLPLAIHQNVDLYEKIKHQHTKKISHSLVTWIFHIQKKLHPDDFQKAFENASKIARRDRKAWEYDLLIHTAITNFMKFRLDWLTDEIDYMKIILVECSFIKSSSSFYAMKYAQDYIAYIVGKSLMQLRLMHQDHLQPKGLDTNISTTILNAPLILVDLDNEDDIY